MTSTKKRWAESKKKYQSNESSSFSKDRLGLQHSRDALQAQVYKEKYLRRSNLNEASRHLQETDSTTWKGLCHGINLLNKGTEWKIGKEDKARFWSNDWHPLGILKEWEVRPLSQGEEQFKVNHLLNDFGWKYEELYQILPREVVNKIIPIHAGKAVSIGDSIIWGRANSREFTVKSAFELCCEEQDGDSGDTHWKWSFIWKLNVAPKIKTFLWTLIHGKV